MFRPAAGAGQDHGRTWGLKIRDQEEAAAENGLYRHEHPFGVVFEQQVSVAGMVYAGVANKQSVTHFTDSTWSRESRRVYASLSGTTVCPRDCCEATASRVSGTLVVSS